EVDVEGHAERGQVRVLLAAQPGDGELTDRLEVVRVVLAGDDVAVDLHALAAQVGGGDVGDVVAVVGVGRPLRVAGPVAPGAGLGGQRQVVDLHAGVVVVELAAHVPAVGLEHARDAVADRAGAAVAHVQRAGGVGRHVLDARGAAAAAVVAAVGRALGVHLRQLPAPCAGREAEVQEAGAGDLHRGDVVAPRQRVDQRLGQRARVRLRRPGQQHRGIGGEVAMRAVLRTLDDEVGRGEVGGQGACVAQGGDGLFD